MRLNAKAWVVGSVVLTAVVLAAAEPPADPPKDAKTKVEELRKRFPFESLTGRLDYEPAGAEGFAKSNPPPQATDETLKRLDASEKSLENEVAFSQRSRALQLLHSDQAERFVERGGFGVSRMMPPPPSTRSLELAVGPTIPFATVRQAAAVTKEAGPAPKEANLAAFQQEGLSDFLNPSGFGYIKDREHVSGFQPHQFRNLPALPGSGKAPPGLVEQWSVVRLELVSLLKHEQPVVYVTHALPRMEDVSDAAVRPLIPFEEKGLKALKDGDDLATETTGDRIRRVGSLRASKQCLDCHQVKRGDLVGAFSWELQRQTVDQPLP